MKIKQKTLRR